MMRLFGFAVAMGLATAAHAETFSFTVGGHHISISAERNCHRAACVSVSGIVASRRKRSDDVATAQDTVPVQPLSKATVIAAPAPAVTPAPQIVPTAPPVDTRTAVLPPVLPPPPAPTNIAATAKPAEHVPPAQPAPDKPLVDKSPADLPPAQQPPIIPPHAAALPAPNPAPVLKVTKAVDTEHDDSPIGDWQTEGKTGAVRIEACGKALCGYLINPSSHAKGETILINMKPRDDSPSDGDSQWRGSIFSRASGNTYNATMTLRGANLLRVEACALGHFLCSRNDWTRVIQAPAALVTSRDDAGEPRS